MKQDLKQTPQKNLPKSHRKRILDESISKQLALPFPQPFCNNHDLHSTLTPLKKQPEYLMTPSPIKKDLFSQLLGTQIKQYYSPVEQNDSIIEEESLSLSEQDQSSQNSIVDQQSEGEANWTQQNGMKKRKRKSTAQIKLLKQELDGQMNWNKQKIAKMAEVTGLSQSQVYKWCWDQKKKQNKNRHQFERNVMEKRKFIKKQGYRMYFGRQEESEQKQNLKQVEPNGRMSKTKLKTMLSVVDGQQTEKKVKKRLIFF